MGDAPAPRFSISLKLTHYPNLGVESTARDAYERGYQLVFAEDAMAGMTAEAHRFAVTTIFPRIGRVRSTDEVLAALA